MNERWRLIRTLMYISVLYSGIYCDKVCLADGFKSFVASYNDVHRLTSAINVSQFEQPSPGNCTNNLTAPDSLRNAGATLASQPVKNESSTEEPIVEEAHQPIATFDEWTKEKLKQEHRKIMPPPAPTSEVGVPSVRSQLPPGSAAATRNYASRECGAKVLLSNPEAENTKAILNEKEKDEYMRNPCEKASNKFVIIELCETVQPRIIELANYELFSSGPREVRLWSAERFPSGEWQILTEITAGDSRHIQQFPIPSNGAYVKFIKVELLSHYGNEHYCTLSVLKILGISMVDEYEAEAEAASVVHTRSKVALAGESKSNGNESTEYTVPADSHLQQENAVPNRATAPAGTAPEKLDGNPTVIEFVDEVSGRLIRKIVNVVKDNFAGVKQSSVRSPRAFKVPNTFTACYFCPKDGTYIYPRRFCQAFVWKSLPTLPLKREDLLTGELGLSIRLDQSILSRTRRNRYAFLQRKSLKMLHTLTTNGNHRPSQPLEQNKPQQSQTKAASDVYQSARVAPTVPVDVWPASSTSHKESVFMKLNKRIAALELNMSLSSEYLSELSRQYVAQTDEHQRHMKQARKVVEEAVESIHARVNETLANKIAVLRKEVDKLSGWLSSMHATAFKMSVGRFTRSEEKTLDQKCMQEQQTELHHYSPPDDGLWTTEQVVYMVVSAQIFTVAILALLSSFYNRLSSPQRLSDYQRLQVEELVNERISEALEKKCSLLQLYEKLRPNIVKQISSHVDETNISNGNVNLEAECSSSSRATNSYESSSEDDLSKLDRSLPSGLTAISSMAT